MGIEATTKLGSTTAPNEAPNDASDAADARPSVPTTDEARKRRILNRLRRLEGQVRGLHRMVDEDRTCEEVLTLLSGVRSALDATADAVLEHYLETCSTGLSVGGDDEVQELLRAVRLARG